MDNFMEYKEYTIEPVSILDFKKEMKLMHAAWKEVDPRDSALNPDFELMQELDEQGVFQVYVIKYNSISVGYWAFMLSPNMFVKGDYLGYSVSLYIEPRHRGIWEKLAKTAIQDVKEAGAKDFIINTKRKNRTLEKLGFKEAETVYWLGV